MFTSASKRRADDRTEYAEFVRLPDFIAGTFADTKLPQMMLTRRKFPPIFERVLVDAPNNAFVELLINERRATSRRTGFRVPVAAYGSAGPRSNAE